MRYQILIRKATKRLGKITRLLLPHQKYFRPMGILRLPSPDTFTQKLDDSVTIHNIYPGLKTTLDISDELYQACSEYWKPQRSVVTDYVVVEVPNGRLHTDNESSIAIISQDNKLIDNVSLSLKDGKVTAPEKNNVFRQRMFTKPVKINGTLFTMLSGGAGMNNIGHWFLDVLPRLHLLQKSGLMEQVDWFLVPSLRYSYQTETLDMLGIPKYKILSGEHYTHITADRLLASTAPRGNHTLVPKWLIHYMRAAFLPAIVPHEERTVESEGPLLFISRKDSSVRNVLNEDELQHMLGQYGFNTIVSSNHSIAEKVRLFSKAKFILSPTGAGLISMLFCQPGTKLVEIFNEGFVIEPFYDIATKLDLDYNYIICKAQGEKAKNAAQGQKGHLVVETEKVEEMLEKMVIQK